MSKSTGCRNEPSTSENDTMTMRMRFLFAALTLALAAGSCSREPRTELFNGRDLAGWVCVTDPEGVGDARDAFSVQNGNIRIAGSPFGYMRTEETYDDYRLHVEWRWIGEATNSGIFQRVQAGDRLWPEAVECQLQAGRAGDLPDAFIREQIRNSYLLVVRRSVTPRSLREEILRHVEEHGLPE